MKSHEFAKLLLELPDLEIEFEGWGKSVPSIIETDEETIFVLFPTCPPCETTHTP